MASSTSQFDPILTLKFIKACKDGDLITVKSSLNNSKVDIHALDDMGFRCSVFKRNYELITLLLEEGKIVPSVKDNAAIILASTNKDHKTVKLLLTYDKVDPCARNNQAMRSAIENNDIEMIKILILTGKLDPIKVVQDVYDYSSRYFEKAIDILSDINNVQLESENVIKTGEEDDTTIPLEDQSKSGMFNSLLCMLSPTQKDKED